MSLVLGVTMHLGLPPASSVAPVPSRCVCSALGCVRCCAGFAAGIRGCVGPLGRARVYFAPPPHMCCRVRAMNFGCQQPGTHFVESVVGLVVSFSSTNGRVLLREKTTHRRVLFSTKSIAFHELYTGTGYQSTRQGLRRERVSYDFSPARHQRGTVAAEILWHHGLLGGSPPATAFLLRDIHPQYRQHIRLQLRRPLRVPHGKQQLRKVGGAHKCVNVRGPQRPAATHLRTCMHSSG